MRFVRVTTLLPLQGALLLLSVTQGIASSNIAPLGKGLVSHASATPLRSVAIGIFVPTACGHRLRCNVTTLSSCVEESLLACFLPGTTKKKTPPSSIREQCPILSDKYVFIELCVYFSVYFVFVVSKPTLTPSNCEPRSPTVLMAVLPESDDIICSKASSFFDSKVNAMPVVVRVT